MMNKEDTGASSLREDRVTAADRQHARKPAMNPACLLCGEPTSLDYCAACVEPEASRFASQDAPTSWLTIAAAAVGTGGLLTLLWTERLF